LWVLTISWMIISCIYVVSIPIKIKSGMPLLGLWQLPLCYSVGSERKKHHLSSGSHTISLLVYSRETIYKVIRRYLFRLVHKTSTYPFPHPPNFIALWCKVNRVSLIFFPTRLLACLMVHFMSFVVLKSYFTVPLQAYVKRNQTVWLTLVNMISLLCFRLNGKKTLK